MFFSFSELCVRLIAIVTGECQAVDLNDDRNREPKATIGDRPPNRYFSFLTSTFDLRPLWSYFSRRVGGKSSGDPSTNPPLDMK